MEKLEKTMSPTDDPIAKVGTTMSLQGSAFAAEEGPEGRRRGRQVLRRIDLW
jgi:hypothetical protein